MKQKHARNLAGLLIAGLAMATAKAAESAPPNTLSAAEKAAGWKLLFNGKNLEGWRNFKKKEVTGTQAWVVEDGWLKKVARVRGGDIITTDQFENFEFAWEWRIPARANNGVKYFITEERSGGVGHEYQMIDDSVVKSPKGMTGSFYDVLPRLDHQPVKIAPEINQSRILVQGNRVEHWLNGEKIIEYECGSQEVLEAVAKSKFKNVAGFGKKIKGHILLTDHNDECCFRNLKIRELPAR